MQAKQPTGRERDAALFAKIDAVTTGHEHQHSREPAMVIPEPSLDLDSDSVYVTLFVSPPDWHFQTLPDRGRTRPFTVIWNADGIFRIVT